MSSYFVKVPYFEQTGAYITVKLCPAQLILLETPLETVAKVDTGCATTLIIEGVATGMGLEPVGTTFVSTLSSPRIECYQYRLRVLMTENHGVEVTATEVPYIPRHDQRVKCIIGRDILKDCILHFDGPAKQFSLTISEGHHV